MAKATIKVLIVEDEPDFVHTTITRLQSAKDISFLIDSVEDVATAKKFLSERSFDIVLLDLDVKDSHGLNTLLTVHSQAKHLPIIVLTGEYDETVGPEALKLGAQGYFMKGQIEPQALVRAIRYAIERKRQEEVLRRAYSEVSQLLDLVPSVLIRIDPDDRIIAWNPVAEHVLGVPHKQAIHQIFSQCGATWDYSILSQGIAECRTKKKILRLGDITFRRKDGQEGYLGVTVNPIIEADTQRVGVLIYGADITERRRLEGELPNG